MTISAKLAQKIISVFANGPGTEFLNVLNDAGADGSGSFTTLTADSVIADLVATSADLPYARLYEESGVAYLTFAADADTTWEMYADPATSGVISVTVTCASGKYEKNLTDNLANAYSVKINSGNAFYTLVSTNNAETFRIDNTFSSAPPADQALTANGQTITLPTGINKVVAPDGAYTGIIMTAGTVDGQIVNVINASANTITFHATPATGRVADGNTTAIAANRAVTLVWDSGSSLWYKTG